MFLSERPLQVKVPFERPLQVKGPVETSLPAAWGGHLAVRPVGLGLGKQRLRIRLIDAGACESLLRQGSAG